MNRLGHETILEHLRSRGVSRRGFLKYCSGLASVLALPPELAATMARSMEGKRRPSLIWLSFQECSGCGESLTRSFSPNVEDLIFDLISLDYMDLLQATSGFAAEEARKTAMQDNWGEYLLAIDGSVATGKGFCTIAGANNVDVLKEAMEGAAAVIGVGTCAAFGGLPFAHPNPTGAVPVSEIVREKPLINLPGCPPMPEAISAVVAHYVSFGVLPELDEQQRPKSFYGNSIHDRCYRRPFYERGQFAETFDDEGARKGWCLYKLGCKGPVTYNACATIKWNGGTSFPIQAGHGCLGCSESGFWDKGGFYRSLPMGIPGSAKGVLPAALGGVVAGAGAAAIARKTQKQAQANTPTKPSAEDAGNGEEDA